MNDNITIVIVVTTIMLVAISTISATFAQSSDPGAVGHQGDSPIDYDPSEEPGHLGCTSEFASGEKTSNPHRHDEGGDDE